MPEMAAAIAAKSFLAHEEALEHAAARICQALTRDAKLTPAECFVVCLRAAAKFLILTASETRKLWREFPRYPQEALR